MDAIGLGAIFALMAVGIGLVFGVLRLVNFAYGQLIMAGGVRARVRLASGAGRSAVGIALCFVVVVALSLAMERVVFRPLRAQSPAVMLVATFAVAFLLQSIALLWFGPLGKTAASLAGAQPAGLDRRRRDPEDHDRRDRRRRRSASRCSCCCSNRTIDRAAHARGGDGLPDGAARRRAGERS